MRKKIEKVVQMSKKEEGKNYILSQVIKKVFAFCVQSEKETVKNPRESTQVYTNSTISPNQYKIHQTPQNSISSSNF